MEPGSEVGGVEAIREVLRRHPIRIGVCFGSQVHGTTHPASDVDVAIEIDPSVSDGERRTARLDVTVDRSRTGSTTSA